MFGLRNLFCLPALEVFYFLAFSLVFACLQTSEGVLVCKACWSSPLSTAKNFSSIFYLSRMFGGKDIWVFSIPTGFMSVYLVC